MCGVTSPGSTLIAEYRACLRLLISKSPLSHDHIAQVLRDMLESDFVILWELMGSGKRAAPFEEALGEFMEGVQGAASSDERVKEMVRASIAEALGQFDERLAVYRAR